MSLQMADGSMCQPFSWRSVPHNVPPGMLPMAMAWMRLVGPAFLLLGNVSWGGRAKYLSTSHACYMKEWRPRGAVSSWSWAGR